MRISWFVIIISLICGCKTASKASKLSGVQTKGSVAFLMPLSKDKGKVVPSSRVGHITLEKKIALKVVGGGEKIVATKMAIEESYDGNEEGTPMIEHGVVEKALMKEFSGSYVPPASHVGYTKFESWIPAAERYWRNSNDTPKYTHTVVITDLSLFTDPAGRVPQCMAEVEITVYDKKGRVAGKYRNQPFSERENTSFCDDRYGNMSIKNWVRLIKKSFAIAVAAIDTI